MDGIRREIIVLGVSSKVYKEGKNYFRCFLWRLIKKQSNKIQMQNDKSPFQKDYKLKFLN